MDKDEIKYEYGLSYADQMTYLQKKYGIPSGPYFLDEACTTKNRQIMRGKEGLQLHHGDEWNPNNPIAFNLSKEELAAQFSYDYQQPDHLCYGNLIEHYILHIKINLLRTDFTYTKLYDGYDMLDTALRDLYTSYNLTQQQEWNLAPIEDNYEDYVYLHNDYLKKLKERLG